MENKRKNSKSISISGDKIKIDAGGNGFSVVLGLLLFIGLPFIIFGLLGFMSGGESRISWLFFGMGLAFISAFPVMRRWRAYLQSILFLTEEGVEYFKKLRERDFSIFDAVPLALFQPRIFNIRFQGRSVPDIALLNRDIRSNFGA